ncbi:helical backbone metal receptor [Congregibacter variabilis]|uniref:Helical backbone metal receptor n=1 Tax=Congregibacter variabilis TaxID=3081200 RepID=A0ABZ0I5R1_9GAMM|nr:helical backbone metal receptor [Congregibacter sp. IMCC43200]
MSLHKPAQRVIALAPHIVENLYSIDAQSSIVGAVQYSDYPEPAREIPRVGGVGSMSLEKIVALQPDLVILWGSGTPPGLRSGIERLGLPYFIDEVRSLADLKRSLQALGKLTGRISQAEQITAELQSSIAQVTANARTEGKAERPKVFLQLWNQPLQSIGKDHLLNEVIERCGGRSITDSIIGLAPLVSMERVLADDPELIIVENQQQSLHWNSYPQLHAIQSDNVVVINPDLLHRPTLRLLQGMQIICERVSASRRDLND